jgi:putative component of toxin-antitoxin plasmid stabilization module
VGGDKRSQTKDIERAKTFWKNYLQENKRGKTK